MSEVDEYSESCTRNYWVRSTNEYEFASSNERERGFISKIFSKKRTKKKALKLRNPLTNNRVPAKKLSPRKVGRLMPNERVYYQAHPDTVLLEDMPMHYYPEFEVNSPRGDSPEEIKDEKIHSPREHSKKEKLLQAFSRDNAVVEFISVEDRGTDPWDQRTTVDRGTDPFNPLTCTLPACQNERKLLNDRVQENEKSIESSFREGCNLLKEIDRIKETVSESSEVINENPSSVGELIQMSYKSIKEISTQLSLAQKKAQENTKNITDKLTAFKNKSVDDEVKINTLEKLLSEIGQHEESNTKLRAQNCKLVEALQDAKEQHKGADRVYKENVDKLEKELSLQKQSNAKNVKTAEERTRKVDNLERTVDKLRNSIDEAKQQISELHASYKSKIAKLEQDHSSKISDLCANQAQTNKQLTHALDQSSKYVNLYQEVKKENVSLVSANRVHQEKTQLAQREMEVAVERSLTAERKLAREAKQVEKLKDQLSRLSEEAEQELLTVDGDLWCQIMKHRDQAVLDEYAASLQEKEKTLEGLRAQGDCALKDFESAQNDLQKRRQQFKDLRGVVFDFQRKRETVVREQREFYSKMARDKAHVSKDTFFQSLIEECQAKSERIEELEDALNSIKNRFEESNKISAAQLNAMQAEMNHTADKLQEFQNQIRMKEMQLQEVIKVFEQEKRSKLTVEEAMNSYKIMLEDSKNENSELRRKINLFEENYKTHVMRTAENITVEQKRIETESTVKRLEKELHEMKNHLQSGKTMVTDLNKMDLCQLKSRIEEVTEYKMYIERILLESQQSKELIIKDNEVLIRRLNQAMRLLVKSKAIHEDLERRLERRTAFIEKLEASQLDTEERLRALKDVMHEMRKDIEDLEDEREALQAELESHSHCQAELTLAHKLKLLQREKKIAEENYYRERESLLNRNDVNEAKIRDLQKHIRDLQGQLDMLTDHLRETKLALNSERHEHTQAALEKNKLELTVQELEARLLRVTRQLRQEPRQAITTDTADSSPQYTSDSYHPPHRETVKPHHFRK